MPPILKHHELAAGEESIEPTAGAATPRANGLHQALNILLVASSLCIGGAEMVICHLARQLDRRRFAVTVCYLKDRGELGQDLASSGINVVGVNDGKRLPSRKGRKGSYTSFVRLAALARRERIHIVHTHTTDGLADATLCRLLYPGVRHVHTFHFGNYPHASKRDIRFERWFAPRADRLIAVGTAQRRQLQALYRFPDDRVATATNGVSLPTAHSSSTFRERFGIGQRVVVGTIATLIAQKGLRDLMLVAQRLQQLEPGVCFVIVGDGPMRSQLESLRRELKLEATVLMAGWMMRAAEVALPSFDIFFQPSLWEAMSVVTLEAMAAGKAAVVTAVGEAPYIIEDGVDGMLVPPTDVDAMARALAALIRDPALRARMGNAARDKVADRHTIGHMTRAYEKIYTDVAQ